MILASYSLDYLKELGELTGINKPITRVTFQGGRRKDTVAPKYTLMTSHICRRTYITELLKRKVPAEIIMQASGHRDYNSFKKYIKLATEDVKSQITEAFRIIDIYLYIPSTISSNLRFFVKAFSHSKHLCLVYL
jgi:hypothetical protein